MKSSGLKLANSTAAGNCRSGRYDAAHPAPKAVAKTRPQPMSVAPSDWKKNLKVPKAGASANPICGARNGAARAAIRNNTKALSIKTAVEISRPLKIEARKKSNDGVSLCASFFSISIFCSAFTGVKERFCRRLRAAGDAVPAGRRTRGRLDPVPAAVAAGRLQRWRTARADRCRSFDAHRRYHRHQSR